jgi:hypothetical protein
MPIQSDKDFPGARHKWSQKTASKKQAGTTTAHRDIPHDLMRERRDIERRVLGCLASAFPYVDAYEKAWAALTSAQPPDPPDF